MISNHINLVNDSAFTKDKKNAFFKKKGADCIFNLINIKIIPYILMVFNLTSNTISSSVNKIQDTSIIVENKFNKLVNTIFNILINQSADLLKFLFERNIVQMAIGLLIASEVSSATKVFTDTVISPIINRLLINRKGKLEEYKYYILGIEFKFGLLLMQIIKGILVLIIVYFIWKLSRVQNFDFIQQFFKDVTPSKNKIIVGYLQ
jgi:large-conductance mechanosensitive channel